MSADLQLGQTRGLWSRSAAISMSASAARNSLIPRRPTVSPFLWRGTAATLCRIYPAPLASANPRGCIILRFLAFSLVLALLPARQERITLGVGGRDGYRMSREHLEVRPGDTLVFEVKGGAPHALGMTPAGMTPAVKAAWNGALPRRVGDLRGPLLHENDRYLVVVPRGLPVGSYRIFCLAHRAYDEAIDLELK